MTGNKYKIEWKGHHPEAARQWPEWQNRESQLKYPTLTAAKADMFSRWGGNFQDIRRDIIKANINALEIGEEITLQNWTFRILETL